MSELPTFLFLDIDTQKDFVENFGARPIPDCGEIRENLMELMSFAFRNQHWIFSTLLVQEFGEFCLKGSLGVEKILDTECENRELVLSMDDELVVGRQYLFEHNKIDPFSSPALLGSIKKIAPTNIIVFGVPTEEAVMFVVERLAAEGFKVWLLKDAVKSYEVDDSVWLEKFKQLKGVSLMTTRNTLKFLSEMVY